MSRASQIRESFLSERLYHFFARTAAGVDEAKGIAVFKSIVENGLLLTIGNQAGEAEEFSFRTGDKEVRVHLEQLARVCFTDIPEDKLQAHGDDAGYGRFAIGFSRATIVSWAGSPVWYLQNVGAGALTDAAGVTLQYSRFGRDAMQVLKILYSHPNCQPTLNFADGATLGPADVVNRADLADGSIARTLSFVKQMSPRDAPGKEFEYLYEREWRIVDGLSVNGAPVCISLAEKPQLREALLAPNPQWGHPIKMDAGIFRNPYFSQPMIDHFRIFNGLGGDNTIAKRLRMSWFPACYRSARLKGICVRIPGDLAIHLQG